MKHGQIVKIFSDPITEKKFEGRARLVFIEREADGNRLELWQVKFLRDNYETVRLIKVPESDLIK